MISSQMLRPWYQSLVFHLGLPGLGFIVWLWAWSMSSEERIDNWANAKGPPFEQWTKEFIVHGNSRLLFSWADFDEMPGRYIERHFTRTRTRSQVQGTTWFPALGHKSGRPDPGQVRHSVSLPHWFFVLLYLGLWLLAYRLRTRWVRRRYDTQVMGEWKARDHAAAAAENPEPPPTPDPRSTRSKIFRRDE
jgi:hypothetical protein